MSNEERTLCLVDGLSYVFRAFHAIHGLSNRQGMATNALYGYVNMLLKVTKDLNPSLLAVALESKTPVFRTELYPAYKANRPPVPPELIEQLPLVEPVTEALGISVIHQDGFEADDVIATLATQAADLGLNVIIVSADKDLMQLVGDRVSMFDSMRDKWYRPLDVQEKMGVPPDRVGDLLAIMGDSSDNVPGVKGIGAKGAQRLLSEWGSLQRLYESLPDIRPERTRNLLEEHRELAFLSKRLVTLRTDVPVASKLEDLVRRPSDNLELRELYSQLGFRTLLRDVLPSTAGPAKPNDAAPRKSSAGSGPLFDKKPTPILENPSSVEGPEAPKESTVLPGPGGTVLEVTTPAMPDPVIVDSPELLARLAEQIASRRKVSLDTETTSISPTQARLVGISASLGRDNAWYIPVAHKAAGARQLRLDQIVDVLGPLLADPSIGIVGQNFKYDAIVLERHGMLTSGLVFDPMIASYLLNPSRSSHGMDALAGEFLGLRTIAYKEVTATPAGPVRFDEVPIDAAARYSGEDAWVTWLLMEKLEPLIREQSLDRLLWDVELPLSQVLARMEMNGIAVDLALLKSLSREFEQRMGKTEWSIYEAAGTHFNVNSPKQLGTILFERLKLPTRKKTKSGYSTDSSVLEELAALHPLPQAILEHRSLAKLKRTYIDVLPALVNPETGRIHTSFNQTVAATGRLSSSDPNLQNIPIRGEEGRRIREAFIPAPGNVFVSADYSQVELRILAHLSGDAHLIESFVRGDDIHTRTAAEIFRVFPKMVTPDMRRVAKTINFGIVYGMSAFRLSHEQKIPMKQARDFIDAYFKRYPGIQDYMDRTKRQAQERGYVETLLGRKRYIPDMNSSRAQERSAAERMAINTPVQGGAADIVKMAMVELQRRLDERGIPARLLLQVHDELVLETPEEHAAELAQVLTETMEGVVTLKVPLKVECGQGPNWAQAHE